MFRRYLPKGGKLGFEKESVRVSNQILAFSSEVWEKCFAKAEKMALFFEEETNKIGLRGDNVNGLAISKAESGDYRVVRWASFVKSIKFSYECPAIKKLTREGVMWVIEKEDKEKGVDFQDESNH